METPDKNIMPEIRLIDTLAIPKALGRFVINRFYPDLPKIKTELQHDNQIEQ